MNVSVMKQNSVRTLAHKLNSIQFIYITTFILAFSSIVYELLLGQALSAFLGNTVLRYSITVGLYLFGMGVGAFIVEKHFRKHPLFRLLVIEIFLISIGGNALILLHLIHAIGISDALFALFGYGLIVAIGILTGFEIPLLIYIINNSSKGKENKILGISYLGALGGSLVFAFYFFPTSGLIKTAFIVALLNALGGLFLVGHGKITQKAYQRKITMAFFILFILGTFMLFGIFYAEPIQEYLTRMYLGLP